MPAAEVLNSHDRCTRKAFLEQDWERVLVSPTSALYQGIEEGLAYDGDEDPGQVAGDTVFTLASERGLDVPQSDQLGNAQHVAALSDILVHFLRKDAAWERPEDVTVGKDTLWESSAWLDPSGTKLRRVILVDWWGENRKVAESHSWRTFGECVAYDLPMEENVIVVGQNRDGRRHSPWSKAWVHPVGGSLRMRKRDGEPFSGKWRPVWREEVDYNRDTWIETMVDDGVLTDVVYQVEVPAPTGLVRAKMLDLIQRKMAEIRGITETPPPCPSICDDPISPCQFRGACWNFVLPSESNGFIRIT